MKDGRFRFQVGQRVRMLPYAGEIGMVTLRRYGKRRQRRGERESRVGVEYDVRRFEQGYSVRMREHELEPE